MMTAGLDHWFKGPDGRPISWSKSEKFLVEEWRLQRYLGVDHFREPPEFAPLDPVGTREERYRMTVPAIRFPAWHFCLSPKCRSLTQLPLSAVGRQTCSKCDKDKWKSRLAPVPFIAICEGGHVMDFPWREWVHRTAEASCSQDMKLIATGGASLSAQEIRCGCGKRRTLEGITNEEALSRSLTGEGGASPYLCPGVTPWHGDLRPSPCEFHVRGALRSATNVYFAVVKSSIYLPRDSGSEAPSDLITSMETSTVAMMLRYLFPQDSSDSELEAVRIRGLDTQLFEDYSDAQIVKASRIVLGFDIPLAPEIGPVVVSDDAETSFRRTEFSVLRQPQRREQLHIEEVKIGEFGKLISDHFDQVLLVRRLRETRALVGFQRVNATPDPDFGVLESLLRRKPPATRQDDWLPAYSVFGEGIFLELAGDRLRNWELRDDVRLRTQALARNYGIQLAALGRDYEAATAQSPPRLVLAHTLSHLIVNELVFEAGYGSASLRERLYISDDEQYPMAGILIYTAAGDSEGTLGGLVRMGTPGKLDSVLAGALDSSRWCASDPVCMEAGEHGGQGPNSCNLAACHNCSLVPETTCEAFNRFLDRWVVSGSEDARFSGYFDLTDLVNRR